MHQKNWLTMFSAEVAFDELCSFNRNTDFNIIKYTNDKAFDVRSKKERNM